MDDSFADFQENKRIKLGPKTIPKRKKSNPKKLKRSKGQKDIRSLIKKNELVSYSQDFDEICKQSGVDVDAEQLQLAIALSKSLNECQSSSDGIEIESRQLSSQERSAKIRTTLQEYGFKVNNPKVLLSLSTNKRKKYKKHSKLLQISNEERQQKIYEKYSEVLASNIYKSDEDQKCIYLKDTVFYKATNISYNDIKNNEVFYVSNLIDKPKHKTCLLRDWSEIPGRPVSPKPMHNDINFDNIQCSQDELDNILSGSVDDAQKIINSKQNVEKKSSLTINTSKDYPSNEYSETNHVIEPKPTCSNDLQINQDKVPIISDSNEVTEVQIDDIDDREKENIECIDLLNDTSLNDNCSQKTLKVTDSCNVASKQTRSVSPDLFDDEVTIMEDKNDCSTIQANDVCSIIKGKNNCSTIEAKEACSIIKGKNDCSTIQANDICSIIKDKNDCSTLEAKEVCSIKDKNDCSTIINEVHSIIQDKNNSSKDNISKFDNCNTFFMDLTECANIDSNLKVPIDVTKRKSNDHMDITECVDVKSSYNSNIEILSSGETKEDEEKDVELIDLTQVSNLVYDSPVFEKSGTRKDVSLEEDDTVIYDDVFTRAVNKSVDLQEPIVICDEESILKDDIKDKKLSKCDNALNNSNHNISDDDNEGNSENVIENLENYYEFEDYNGTNIDLAQGSDHSDSHSLNCPEFEYDCGSETVKHNSSILNKDKDSDTISLKSVTFDNDIENNDDNIDLTQDSEKSFETTDENYEINCNNNSKLEKFNGNVGTSDKNNSILIIENKAVNIQSIEEDNDKIDLTQFTEDIEEGNNTLGYSYIGSKSNSKLEKNNKNNNFYESIEVNEFVEENDEDDKIDLTQGTDIEERNTATDYSYITNKNNSKLGKIDNVSIDYDEMFDEIASESRNVSKCTLKSNSSGKYENKSNSSGKDDISEVFEISDKELNYSIHHSIHEKFNIDFENTGRVLNRSLSEGCLPTVGVDQPLNPIKEKNKSQTNTPIKINRDAIIQTPKNNDYIIKTRDVTPMPDYEAMMSPERNKELEKYGLKPFKRKRAIQLLTYVYNETHPIIESCSPEEGPSKRCKYSSPKKKSKSPKKCLNFGSNGNKENDIFIVTKETPDIKNIECDPREWVFQNREKAKVHSCRVPLHIAFHNYVSCRQLLREAILRYEPVNIDVIHKDLVSYGHKYNPKDLLKFMDRKCITVKTVENNLRNKK